MGTFTGIVIVLAVVAIVVIGISATKTAKKNKAEVERFNGF